MFTSVGNAYLGLDLNGSPYGLKRLFPSSRRVKKNIKDLRIDSSRLFQLRPVSYDWKDGGKSFGLIAEEVQEILPELVILDPQTNEPYSVNYELLSVLLLDEIKKMKQSVDEKFTKLNHDISELRVELAEIKGKSDRK